MALRLALTAAALVVLIGASPARAAEQVPFRGVWAGQTISAEVDPDNPALVTVVSSGIGQATHLGRFTMESPHVTNLGDLTVFGQQIFTAANGDKIFATFSGQFVPTGDGVLESTLSGTITGGTGRFANASGSYDFVIVARPAAFGFASTAIFAGTIASPGSLR